MTSARRLSLTARLTVLFTLISATILVGLGWLVAQAIDRHFVELDRDSLHDRLHLVHEALNKAPLAVNTEPTWADMPHHHEGFSLRVERGGQTVYDTPGFQIPAVLRADTPDAANDVVTWEHGGVTYRGLTALLPARSDDGAPWRVWLTMRTEHHEHFLEELRDTLLLYVLVATAVSGVLGWWAARSGLHPLRAMRARAQGVTAHRLDERMPVQAVPVELADLATTLNEMLERLQQDFRRLSDFSSDLAHELRTPISNLLMETQVALSQPRAAEEYRDILASNAEELQRLARMVSDMLFLAKAEHGLALPTREPIAVAGEVQALFDFYEALAEERQVALRLAGDGRIAGDRLMLRRALSNLLSNALRYTPAQGEVAVTIDETPEAVRVGVENTGPDIPPDALPRLFDRFYRADAARAGAQAEGAGLGLSITRAIVQAHGGEIRVASHEGRTRFMLTFPKHA